MLVEIVCCSVDDCLAAERAGAGRIELCQALAEGGLTPSAGLLQEALAQVKIPIAAMVRPRRSGFHYSPSERAVMERDVESHVAIGAHAVVFGCLDEEGRIDHAANARLIARKGGCDAVFHRAFDVVPDPREALETLIDLGFKRVLTSGQQASALEGAELVKSLVEQADGRIEILPAGGLRPQNVLQFVRDTGCDQVHLAPLLAEVDLSVRGRGHIRFGAKSLPPEDEYTRVDEAAVLALVEATGR